MRDLRRTAMPPSRSSRASPPVSLQVESKGGKMPNKHDEKWNTRFKELLDYRSEHGNCDVPVSQGKLGQWVSNQRRAHMAEALAQDRINRLSSIGLKWTLIGPNVPWETRFHELVQYNAKHGDCDVSTKQGKLGKWVGKQRAVYMAGSLAQDRIDRLNSISFRWTSHEVRKEAWETRFNELVQYKAKHGDCNVPRSQGPLGMWVYKQRGGCTKNKLSQDRIDRLNDIGFDWTPPMGGSRKRKALPSSREQFSSRQMRVPSLSTKAESPSTGARERYEPKKGEGFDSESSLPLQQIQSSKSNHNLMTESDDEVDEIGALIYDQVMRRRQFPTK